MSDTRRVSIIINNYNYGRFLRDAIDSALNQTYPHTEVIVVDDGSTDYSREIIGCYGDRIIPVLKENGGQASAFNAGFAASHGTVICFLDSDDALLPSTIGNTCRLFLEAGVAKVHWPLWIVDEQGRKTGELKEPDLPEGDFRVLMMRNGPASVLPSAPTSGNAWARSFLEQVMPIPEVEFQLCADSYLFGLAPAFGVIKRLPDPQGLFRRHGSNSYQSKSFEEKMKLGVAGYEQQRLALLHYFLKLGLTVDPQAWHTNSWWPRLEAATQEIKRLVAPGDAFILVDEDKWGVGEAIRGRRCIPFLERDSQYWGPPPDDVTAIRELERLRQTGALFMVFGWPAFWWLNHYSGLSEYLRSRFPCILENDRLIMFDLHSNSEK